MGLVTAILGLTIPGCESADALPDGYFPCGDNGGSCELGVEVCAVVGGCSTCIAAPAACEADAICGCLDDAVDADPVLASCHELGMCTVDEGGVSVSCEMSDPEIGCG